MSRPPVEAVLQAGDTETLYRRAGEGPPVLLLCTGALADPLGGRLFERLATRFRVVAPAVPDAARGAAVLAAWLDEVTEGLGLVRPSVVIDEALAAALLDGELAAPDAFAAVVVVPAVVIANDDAAAIAAALISSLERGGGGA